MSLVSCSQPGSTRAAPIAFAITGLVAIGAVTASKLLRTSPNIDFALVSLTIATYLIALRALRSVRCVSFARSPSSPRGRIRQTWNRSVAFAWK